MTFPEQDSGAPTQAKPDPPPPPSGRRPAQPDGADAGGEDPAHGL